MNGLEGVLKDCKRKKSVKGGKKCPGPLDGSRGISIIGVVPVEKSGTPAPEEAGCSLKDLEMCLSDAPVNNIDGKRERARTDLIKQ